LLGAVVVAAAAAPVVGPAVGAAAAAAAVVPAEEGASANVAAVVADVCAGAATAIVVGAFAAFGIFAAFATKAAVGTMLEAEEGGGAPVPMPVPMPVPRPKGVIAGAVTGEKKERRPLDTRAEADFDEQDRGNLGDNRQKKKPKFVSKRLKKLKKKNRFSYLPTYLGQAAHVEDH
jgi:hypothetical protein